MHACHANNPFCHAGGVCEFKRACLCTYVRFCRCSHQVYLLHTSAVDARTALTTGCGSGGTLAPANTPGAPAALAALCSGLQTGCWVNADTVNGA